MTASLSVMDWKAVFCVLSGRMEQIRCRTRVFTTDEQGCQNVQALFFGSANEGSFDRQGRVLVPRHSEKQHILRRKWFWSEYRTALRSGIKALWEEKVRSVKKIWMRLQNVWKRSEFASDDTKAAGGEGSQKEESMAFEHYQCCCMRQ